MEWQLRMYRIEPGRLEEFAMEWKEKIVPLRRGMGFTIGGAWTIPEGDRFVWLVGYDGPEGFEARNDQYYASPERAAFDPDPARLITQGEHWMASRLDLPRP